MNDKQQIEEMAKCKRLTNEELNDFTQRVVVQLEPTLTQQVMSLILELTEYRSKIENGTLKEIPKDSVVLTSEEYSDYLILQRNHEFIKEKAKELQEDNERLYKNIGKFKDIVRKKTASEFAEKIRDYLNDKVCEEFGDNACDVTYFTIDVDKVISDVFELAEQYCVEVEEL